jgi:phosphoenolpyruvate carboxylase
MRSGIAASGAGGRSRAESIPCGPNLAHMSDHASPYRKIDDDRRFILNCYAEMLTRIGEAALIPLFDPNAPRSSGYSPATIDPEKRIQSLSIYFQLMTLVEENAATQFRRRIESRDHIADVRGSWAETLREWQRMGLSEDAMLRAISATKVTPVLTAHPTEAKRVTVIELHRELYLLLVERENRSLSVIEQHTNRERIILLLERWWRTGEIYLEKPDVTDERANILYYLTKIFPTVLERSDRQLKGSWIGLGLDPEMVRSPDAYPQIGFGSWVGGDRDGHPLVTAGITRDTLRLNRTHALELLRARLHSLASALSISAIRTPVPAALSEAIERKAGLLGEAGAQARKRNPYEPWRQYVNLMRVQVENTIAENQAESHRLYRSSGVLAEDLRLLRTLLIEHGMSGLAEDLVFPVERATSCFGFHLATLDIRQNSAFHDKAVVQILAASGMEDADFESWDEAKRVEVLNRLLERHEPITDITVSYGPEADQVLDCYRVVRQHIHQYGSDGIGSFIVSMTRQLSDLLAVYLLMQETQLLNTSIRVVPLFETIDDLIGAPDILDAFLAHTVTRRRAAAFDHVHEVMLGYSDSNKDGGTIASKWNLHKAEIALTEVARERNSQICFFHGTGGTISRGGSKYHRFLESMPDGTVNGRIKITVQGESVAQQFGNPLTATYNLNALTAGVAKHLVRSGRKPNGGSLPYESMVFLAEASYHHYRDLIETPGFLDFYSQATCIDVLEQSKIGSRPARRTGTRTLRDLRAIPWVFSWNLSRITLTGWYGLGHALTRLKEEKPDAFEGLKTGIREWPFFKFLMIQTETNLILSNMEIMRRYADLVENTATRDRFIDMILTDHERGFMRLAELFGEPTATRRSGQYDGQLWRHDALVILHGLHIEELRRWRAMGETDSLVKERSLTTLLSIINAISCGLKNTG